MRTEYGRESTFKLVLEISVTFLLLKFVLIHVEKKLPTSMYQTKQLISSKANPILLSLISGFFYVNCYSICAHIEISLV